MSYILGTDNSNGVPTSIEFTFDGTAVSWGGDNLYSMAPLVNRSETVDGDYELSELDIELIDTNGSIWTALGNGTSAFYKSLCATVYVGGHFNLYPYGPVGASRLRKDSNASSATYVMHTGQIVEVGKYNRLVHIKSQNNLKALEDMEWRFPYSEGVIPNPSKLGTFMFFPTNFGTRYPNSVFDVNAEGNEFSVYAAVSPTATTTTEDGLAYWYPTIPNRGTLGLLPLYVYPGTQFYTDYSRVEFVGSFLDIFVGTIENDAQAWTYGFASRDAADAAKVAGNYPIYKTRLSIPDGTLSTGSLLYLQQNLTLTETPANLFRELVTGHCVTPYFGTSDIEQSSFGSSQRVTVYQTFSQKIDPKGGKVGPYIKDLIGATYGNFSVDVNNKFVYRAYGPRNLNANIGTLDSSSIVESSFTSRKDDAKNRIVLKYAWSYEADKYNKTIEVKGDNWSGTTDNPLVIESKWMQNDNEANVFAKRLLNRFKNTAPKIDLTVSMKHVGVDLGSLFNVIDADSGLNNKTVEIVSYEKDFVEERKVNFHCIDGEAVYSRKGYGQWMSGTVQPSGMVSGTSTWGWGTSGTMAGINTSLYGTMFVWW